ncbi:hypothetical protein C8J57DRAFT_1469244 [Mycena rebaudengoi]|nr:hypothetical protein C8J57DRAFT_1469244 [Mycena rebaudengoi]
MPSELDSTMGIWLVSLFVATLLYGMGLIQMYLYFHWYPKDNWKSSPQMVETLHITFYFGATYFILITHWGDSPEIAVITWLDTVRYSQFLHGHKIHNSFVVKFQLVCGFLSAFIVQVYFAYCIYTLVPKSKIMPISIVILAFTQIGSGIGNFFAQIQLKHVSHNSSAQGVLTQRLGMFTLLDETKVMCSCLPTIVLTIISYQPTTTLQAVSTLACDATITSCLCYILNSKRAGVRRTNSLLNTLMINAVNRGMLTTFAAALNLVLFFAVPHTFWFFIGLIPSSNLYMNSMLATLNTRQHLRARILDEPSAWNSIAIGTLKQTTAPPIQQETAGHSKMSVGNFNQFESADDDRKKKNFPGDMI